MIETKYERSPEYFKQYDKNHIVTFLLNLQKNALNQLTRSP